DFFSDDNLKRSLPQLKAGATPNSKTLTRVLAVANANSAKRTQLTFGRGEQAGTMDAQINVKDNHPEQIFSWLNNTGNAQSTKTRLGVAYAHRNVADLDHQFSMSATISPEDTHKIQQFGASYRIPVYSMAGIVNVLAAKSEADTGRVADAFDVSGGGKTFGIGYTQILNKMGAYRQQVQLNLYDKLFDNNIDFEGRNIGQDVRSRPLSVAYQGEWNKNGWTGLVNVSHTMNQSGGSVNDAQSYAASRVGAEQDWQKTNALLQFEYLTQTQWQLGLSLAAQSSSDALIAGEKMGLGGVSGLRGFEERETSFDEAYLLNLNAWMPTKKNVSIGAFYNTGHGSMHFPQAGETGSDTLSSAGLGLRWNWRSQFLMDLYYGHVLDGVENALGEAVQTGTQKGDGKLHFNLMYRFK
ncbi:MAG: ShlB/FhaC/HecB family hemolysin secretion/activation protein, partial [Arenicellales bacterium]